MTLIQVTNVWLNVINSELKKLDRANSETKLAAIGSKMKTLGRSYASSEQFFPLEFIVKTLETYSIRWNGDPGWVTSILLAAEIPFQRVFSVYHKLHQAKDPIWQVTAKEKASVLHLIDAFTFCRPRVNQITCCKCLPIC